MKATSVEQDVQTREYLYTEYLTKQKELIFIYLIEHNIFKTRSEKIYVNVCVLNI